MSKITDFILYGIPNCDTVKKARIWLNDQQIPYTFHDFKKTGIQPERLQRWIALKGWEPLLNKRGTTWRKLTPDAQAQIVNAEHAIAAMLQNPSLIKRPVLEMATTICIGFDPVTYKVLTT